MRKPLRQRLPKLWVFPQAARTLLCQRKETLTATELWQAGPAGVRQAPDGVGEKGEFGVTRDAAEGHCGAHTEALLVFAVPPGLGVADIRQRPAVPCGKINGDLAGLLLHVYITHTAMDNTQPHG